MGIEVRNRNVSMDALKTFLIILVIWGHAIHFLNSEIDYLNPIYRFIYSFHMPVFMAVSGFFASSMLKRSLSANLILKFKQLIVPCLFWGLFIAIFVKYYSGSSTRLGAFVFCFWFLKSLFICSITLYVLKRYLPHKLYLICCFVAFLLFQVCGFFKLDLMWPSFLMGVLISNKKEWILKNRKIIFAFSTLAFIVCECFWDLRMYGNQSITLRHILLPPPEIRHLLYVKLFRLAVGCIGIVFFILLFKIISKNPAVHKFMKLIDPLGQETLGIYILQVPILEILIAHLFKFDNVSFEVFNFIIVPLFTFITYALCLLCIRIIRRLKLGAFLLGDKR